MSGRTRQGLAAIFTVPFLLAVLSSVALIVALTGDGWRDGLSWVALAAPVLTVGWAMRIRRS